MRIHIVCTSKPCDGLFYYSYEYTQYLATLGLDTTCVFLVHPMFKKQDYVNAIETKYSVSDRYIFADDAFPGPNDITLVMGRSMITLPFLSRGDYDRKDILPLFQLFEKVISVYSTNHNELYYQSALEFFNVKKSC